jgi:hypothetical protein
MCPATNRTLSYIARSTVLPNGWTLGSFPSPALSSSATASISAVGSQQIYVV